MDDLIKQLFGDFGVWLLGLLGLGISVLLAFVSQQFWALKVAVAEQDQLLADFCMDLNRVKAVSNNAMASIERHDELIRTQFSDVSARLDGVMQQSNDAYRSLSDQILIMQRNVIAQQEDLIKKLKEGL
ncbi:hypothetical protein [Caudoviricetes sp.]|nr:hypothetical protein [Caudoviricetes sp.]